MNLPYHLKGYQNKIDKLSPQALSILKFVLSHSACADFCQRIKKELILNLDTFRLLKKAVLAGYDSSIYTYNWPLQEEIQFWTVVNSSARQISDSYFVLANIQRSTKSLLELKPLYFRAFEGCIELVFSLEETDVKAFYAIEELRYEFLYYHYKASISIWDDFDSDSKEEQGGWLDRFKDDKQALELINDLFEKRKREMTNDQL